MNAEIDPIYLELAAKIDGADTEIIPRILAKLASLDQARLLKALPDRDRERSARSSFDLSEEFARKLGLDKDTLDGHIRELYQKGVVFPSKLGPQMVRNWMQMHDSTLSNPKYDDSLGNEYFDLWAASSDSRPPAQGHLHPESAPLRVVPKWKSIEGVPGVLPFEDMRQILKGQYPIALVPCACKRSYRKRECGVPESSCINVGRTAQYNLDRGVGKVMTYEEALELLEKFEQFPLVSLVINQRDVTQAICNCHSCCCVAHKEDALASSRFVATVDVKQCSACGTCVARCQFGAAQLREDPETGGEVAYVDSDLCRGCGDCVIACPSGNVEMKLVRPLAHIPEVASVY